MSQDEPIDPDVAPEQIARLAHDLFHEHPQRARTLAGQARSAARRDGDHHLEAVCEQALGLAARELLDVPGSIGHFRRAIELADAAGDPRLVAQIRLSLCVSLSYAGDHPGALAEADRAAPDLDGLDAARLALQRSGAEERLGRFEEAQADLDTACRTFHRHGDRLWEARARNNRGILRAQLGALAPAARDIEASRRLLVELGLEQAAAMATNNLGWVAGLQGDVPQALAYYDEAEAVWQRLGVPVTTTFGDRCNTLLQARLITEARAEAERAATEFETAGMVADAAEIWLLAASAALLDRDPDGAGRAARRARTSFRHQRRPVWVARSALLVARAEWQGGRHDRRLLRAARAASGVLDTSGFRVEALEARILVGRIALAVGEPAVAAEALAGARAGRVSAPVAVRVRAWEAEALLRLAEGDRSGARRAAVAGTRVVERYRDALSATELRSSAAGHGIELAELGLGLALDAGRPDDVLSWTERFRASSLWHRPARPPRDAALTSQLAELRALSRRLDEAAGEGGPTDDLARQQRRLEEQIRRRARRARGSAADPPRSTGRRAVAPATAPRTAELRHRLDGAVLVSYFEHRGRLGAVVVGPHRSHLVELGASPTVQAEVEALRFALRRRSRPGAGPVLVDAADAAIDAGAAALGSRLVAPIGRLEPAVAVVVIPTGFLHSVPWSLLPDLRGRSVTVAPSARVWLAAVSRPPVVGPEVLVAGPGLRHADREIRAVRRRRPQALVLRAGRARASAVERALDGASLGHLACHAEFRADNPLFSSLRLADGPLTVYELEHLRRPPGLLVLSACESGLSLVHPGDELMGLTACLLGLGTRTVVGSVVPVADDDVARGMVALHERLRAGSSPALALAEVADHAGGDRALRAAIGSFVCFGAGA